MKLIDNILKEAHVNNFFKIYTTERYPFDIDSKKKDYLEQCRKNGKDGAIITLNQDQINNLIATQKKVEDAKIERLTKVFDEVEELPMVVSYKGNLYLIDGHHRTCTAIILAKKELKVRLFTLSSL